MNYITILGTYYPNVGAHCVGDDSVYANLIWDSGDPIPPESELIARVLEEAKTKKIEELSANCRQAILDGFISSSLGSPFKYDAEDVDQINLIGAVSATSPTPSAPDGYTIEYAVRPVVNGVYQAKYYTTHTHAQLRQVLNDGAAYKLAQLQHFNELRNNVYAAQTLQAIQAIVW